MRRLLVIATGIYVAAALFGHWRERTGHIRCACLPDCWCKRPGIGLFRWVFPYRHSLPRQAAD